VDKSRRLLCLHTFTCSLLLFWPSLSLLLVPFVRIHKCVFLKEGVISRFRVLLRLLAFSFPPPHSLSFPLFFPRQFPLCAYIHSFSSIPYTRTAREASWRRVFDLYAPLLLNLCHYLEHNLHFGVILENEFSVSRGRY